MDQIKNISTITQLISNIIVILTFAYTVVYEAANHEFSCRHEDRFGIPREYFKLNLLAIVKEVSKFIVMNASLFALFCLSQISFNNSYNKYKYLGTYMVLFLFTLGGYGVLKDLNIIKEATNTSCEIICSVAALLIIPLILMRVYCFDKILGLKILAIIFIVFLILYIIDICRANHEIYRKIDLNGKVFAIITKCESGFIIMEVVATNSKEYVIKEKGKYEILKNIQINEVRQIKIKFD